MSNLLETLIDSALDIQAEIKAARGECAKTWEKVRKIDKTVETPCSKCKCCPESWGMY